MNITDDRIGPPTNEKLLRTKFADDSSSLQECLLQVGSFEVQSSEPVHSGLRAPPIAERALQPNFTFVCHPAAIDQPFMRTDFSVTVLSGFQNRLSVTRCHSQ